SSFGALDNTLALGASVADLASVAHPATASKGIAVTRKLWTAAAGGTVSFLALRPRLFAWASSGLFSFDPATGSVASWATPAVDTFIALNGGTPAVIYADGTTANWSSGNAFLRAGDA